MTNTTAASKYIPRRPRISINWNPPFQTSLHKISKVLFFRLTKIFFRNIFCSVSKQKKIRFGAIRKFLKNYIFWNLLSKFGSERGISIDAVSGPPSYVLWCCGGICHQLPTFFSDWLWPYCAVCTKKLNNSIERIFFYWSICAKKWMILIWHTQQEQGNSF